VRISLGEVEIVLDPSLSQLSNPTLAEFPDEHFFTYSYAGQLFGVLMNGHNNLRISKPLANPIPFSPADQLAERMRGLEAGRAVTATDPEWFETRGVWLSSVYLDKEGVLHGFYHAESPLPAPDCAIGENHPWRCKHCESGALKAGQCVADLQACGPDGPRRCINNPFSPHQSGAYAESRDGGLTWTKPGYPRNQFITGSPDYQQAGNFDILTAKDYLYAYYTGDSAYLARSSIADSGRPGTWWKYYCPSGQAGGSDCGFTQPGLGGLATRIPGRSRDTYVSFNTFLNAFVAVDNALQAGSVDLQVSNDGILWRKLSAPVPVPQVPSDWKDILPSIVDALGDSQVSGPKFWIYAVRVTPPLLQRRVLIRIPVTLSDRN
jgi:hypothetical protein